MPDGGTRARVLACRCEHRHFTDCRELAGEVVQARGIDSVVVSHQNTHSEILQFPTMTTANSVLVVTLGSQASRPLPLWGLCLECLCRSRHAYLAGSGLESAGWRVNGWPRSDWTTRKWRSSSVPMTPVSYLSANTTSEASVSPRGKSR